MREAINTRRTEAKGILDMILEDKYIDYINTEASRYGENYLEVLERYLAMIKANFKQDIHDIINEMPDTEI